MILDVEGEKWTAEVGQPWRNQRVGLNDEMMQKGTEITIEGKRSADPKEFVLKPKLLL